MTGSWVVEEGPLCIVLAFPGSNPLHKVDRREPGEPAGTSELWRGVVEVLNGLQTLRGPQWWGGMKYNKPEFTHPQAGAGCSFRRLKFSLWFSTFSKKVSCARVCVCVSSSITGVTGCFEHIHSEQLKKHACLNAYNIRFFNYNIKCIQHSQNNSHISISGGC